MNNVCICGRKLAEQAYPPPTKLVCEGCRQPPKKCVCGGHASTVISTNKPTGKGALIEVKN